MATLSDGETRARLRSGFLYGLGAYGWWGLMPIYFRAVKDVPATEILAHRIVWCGVLLAGVLTLARRWSDVAVSLRTRQVAAVLFVCGLLLAVNWFTYIYAAVSDRIAQASLGYFLIPLVNVAFGLIIFRERLRPARWLAVALAAIGVGYVIATAGILPWISLTIAISFSIYGVLRKLTPVDGLVGLFVETLFLAPVAGGFVVWWFLQQTGTMGKVDWQTDGLLLLSGVVTAVPLLCFGQAARRLPLTSLGFLQYLSPTLQLMLAVFLYDEPFHRQQQISFGFIWLALAIVTVDSAIMARKS